MILSDSERECILQTIRKSGALTLRHWPGGSERRPFSVTVKEDGSPVTSIDLAVNDELCGVLAQLFPADGIYSEERKPDETLSTRERVWVIDPIDGTINFKNGDPNYGILVGLVEQGRVIFGVAYFPALNLLFWAEKGRGAYCNDQSILVSHEKELKSHSLYLRSCIIPEFASFSYPNEVGTAHGFMTYCQGKVSALLVRITTHNEWDYCPFILFIEEAEGKVTDEKGDPILFRFSKPTPKYLVVANRWLHQDLMRFL